MKIFSTIKAMLHYWYWEEFSYADNRFCMFLEKFFSPRIIRWIAFHCHAFTMIFLFIILAATLVSYANKMVDIILNRGIA